LEAKVEQLTVVLETMPLGDKNVLLMKYKEAMPIKEIAHTLNKSESAIKMKLRRAKIKARYAHATRFKSLWQTRLVKGSVAN